jgi:hypothetical protein
MKPLKHFSYFLLSILILLTSCLGKSTLTMQQKEFSGQTWQKFEPVTFSFESHGSSSPYHVLFNISYTDNFNGTELPLICTMTAPSGEERIIQKRFWLRSIDGSRKGNKSNGVYLVTDVIWTEMAFREKGTYNLMIACDHPKLQIPGIAYLALEIKRGSYKKTN